jgi:hypothetical protein
MCESVGQIANRVMCFTNEVGIKQKRGQSGIAIPSNLVRQQKMP